MDIIQEYSQGDRLKTLFEYEEIILNYKRTGQLDRKRAISAYRDFIKKNPDYLFRVNLEATIRQNGVDITFLPDDQIVYNLNQQMLYLSEKSVLETYYNNKEIDKEQ